MRLQLIICHKKELLSFFFYETRANTQQLLPVQTGLYRYDESMAVADLGGRMGGMHPPPPA